MGASILPRRTGAGFYPEYRVDYYVRGTNWKKFMDDNALQPDFRSGVEFRQFLSQYEQLHRDIAAKNKWVQ